MHPFASPVPVATYGFGRQPAYTLVWFSRPVLVLQTHSPPRSPDRRQGDSCSAHPSRSSLAAEPRCLFLPHVMSWASSIAAGLCKQEVIKSVYSSGRQLINSTFSPRWGAETHTGGINLSLASLLSPRMPGFFFLLCFFFLSFKEKMEIVSDQLESELTELCVRNLFIMIWYCSGQHVCYAGDHPAIPSTTGSKCRAAQPAAGRGPRGRVLCLAFGKGSPRA